MSVEIIKAGSFTTVQDKGRFGLAHLGVPVSGFMDDQSAQLANNMLGNNNNEAMLEVTWTGVEFLMNSNCSMAIAGAEFTCYLNNKVVNTDNVIHLYAGDQFKMGQLLQGVRAYVAFAGGFDLPVIANSQSTLTLAALGGFKGRALKTADEIKLKNPQQVMQAKKPPWKKVKSQNIHIIRAQPGPEINQFKPQAIRQAFGQAYQLSQDCSRQGFRLISESIKCEDKAVMKSSGLVAGSLQVIPDGQTILAMKDAQTTGGYPRILVVNQDELHKLAQIRPSEQIYFFVSE